MWPRTLLPLLLVHPARAAGPELKDGFSQNEDPLVCLRPSARVELFEDAGHALFVDDPQRFCTAREDFCPPSTPSDRD